MVRSICLVLLCITHSALCHSRYETARISSDFMICRKMANIIGSKYEPDDDDLVQKGPSGDRGPRGKRGLPGPSGVPDYKTAKEWTAKEATKLEVRLAKLQKELQDLKDNPPKITGGGGSPTPSLSPDEILNAKTCVSKYHAPISIGTRCFALLGNEETGIDHHEALKLCSKDGGRLADVNSRDLYDQIYHFADKTYQVVVEAWTGMTFGKDDELRLNNGTIASFAKWSAYYPKSSSSYSFYSTYKQVLAVIDTGSYSFGLMNVPSHRSYYEFALCEYDLIKPFPTEAPEPEETTSSDDYYYY